jgi:hypothetical protein
MSSVCRLGLLLFAVASIVALLTTGRAEARPPGGDVNHDALVNAIDAALVLQYSAGLLPSINDEGDVNFDEEKNSIDAALILQYSAGLVHALPYIPMPPINGEPTVTSSGLGIYDIRAGAGAVAVPNTTVTVNYTGWFEDGSAFDAGSGVQFPLGAVIEGWREGVPGMRAGGQRRLIIPSDLAYGKHGSDVIPPNATLIFDIELVSVP